MMSDTPSKTRKLVEELEQQEVVTHRNDQENLEEGIAPLEIYQKDKLIDNEKPPLGRDEKIAILVLFSLYFIQGIPIGFYDEAVPYLLIEKGARYDQMGGFSFVLYPFSLKLFFAPLEDSFYFKKFGKRKSYIIPMQYMLSFTFFLSSFYLEDLINSKQIIGLTFLGIFLNALAALQDIAVDGWVITLLERSHVGWGSVCQSVGQSLGVVFGSTIFIQLNSLKFCNRFLYSSPQEEPLVSLQGFMIMISILILLINLCIHFLIREKPVKEKNIIPLTQILKSLLGFYKNKNLRYLVKMQLLWNIGFVTIISTTKIKIMNQGLDKEFLSSISSAMIFVALITSFLVGKYVVQGKEMSFFIKVYSVRFLENILMFMFILFLTKERAESFSYIYVLLSILSTAQTTARFVNSGGFNNRISEEDVGGSYLTFLNSMDNFGRMWCSSAALFLVSFTNYNLMVSLGWIWAILFLFLNYKNIIRLEKLSKEEWSLSYRVD